MTCDCHKDIEARLTERFKEFAPEATAHKVELQGYGFAIIDNVLTVKPYMPYTTAAEFPLKKGGTKWKKQTGNMVFSFCPFCGDKLDKPADGVDAVDPTAPVMRPNEFGGLTASHPSQVSTSGVMAAPAHSKSEYKRRVAQGDPNVLPPDAGAAAHVRSEPHTIAPGCCVRGRQCECNVEAMPGCVSFRPYGVAPVQAPSTREVMQQALAALETAHTGLMWYRGMMPDYVDGSDGEADEEIMAAIEGLRAALTPKENGNG